VMQKNLTPIYYVVLF